VLDAFGLLYLFLHVKLSGSTHMHFQSKSKDFDVSGNRVASAPVQVANARYAKMCKMSVFAAKKKALSKDSDS
jgi:hypothetical protein